MTNESAKLNVNRQYTLDPMEANHVLGDISTNVANSQKEHHTLQNSSYSKECLFSLFSNSVLDRTKQFCELEGEIERRNLYIIFLNAASSFERSIMFNADSAPQLVMLLSSSTHQCRVTY